MYFAITRLRPRGVENRLSMVHNCYRLFFSASYMATGVILEAGRIKIDLQDIIKHEIR